MLYNKDATELIYCPEGKIGNITIPSSVTEIGYAFEGCIGLSSVTFGNTVIKIDEKELKNYTGLALEICKQILKQKGLREVSSREEIATAEVPAE